MSNKKRIHNSNDGEELLEDLKIDTNKKLKIIVENNGEKSPMKKRSPSPEKTKSEDEMSDSDEKSPKKFIPIPGVKLLEQQELKNNFKRPRKFIKFDDELNNAIMYEMDDSDFDCIQEINALQKKNAKKNITEDIFEKIISHLEVYWFQLKNTDHPKSKYTDLHVIPYRSKDLECCICLNKGSTVINPKKTCKECGVVVHTYCSTLNKEYIDTKRSDSSPELIENSSNGDYTTRCVCGKENDTDNMIQCDSCGTWQHMKCEGIDVNVNLDNKYYKCNCCKKMEEEDLNWSCHWCSKVTKPQLRKKNKRNDIPDKCYICGFARKEEDFNSVMGTYYWNNNRKEVPIHTCCAFLITNNLETIQSHLPINFSGRKLIEKIDKEMGKKKCVVCHQTSGFCVKCCVDDCVNHFHPFCGLKENFHVDFDSEHNIFEQTEVIYFCSKHSRNTKTKDHKSIWYRTKKYIKRLFDKELSYNSIEILFDHWVDMRLIVHDNGIIPLIPVLKVLQRTEDEEAVGVCVYDNQNNNNLVFTLIDDVFHFSYK